MWHPWVRNKSTVVQLLKHLRDALKHKDPTFMAALQQESTAANDAELEAIRESALQDVEQALAEAEHDKENIDGEDYQSRNPLISIVQSVYALHLQRHPPIGDALPADLNELGRADPGWWIPGVDIALQHCRLQSKANFPTNNNVEDFRTEMTAQCKIALIGDWGYNNDHATTIAALVADHRPDYVIHLGDIYYSGMDHECRSFLKLWPLRDETLQKAKGKFSFALNGNHEMYSGGHGYFTVVLPEFEQPASYFLLWNQWWKIFGLDSSYIPASIQGRPGTNNADARVDKQYQWLRDNINSLRGSENILLTHYQPCSAFIAETKEGQPLMNDVLELIRDSGSDDIIHGWFFGHEHKKHIYTDARLKFKARLIGDGAFPHPVQTETTPESPDCMQFMEIKREPLPNSDLAMSGYVLLDLDQNTMSITYFNETGTAFFTEKWQSRVPSITPSGPI